MPKRRAPGRARRRRRPRGTVPGPRGRRSPSARCRSVRHTAHAATRTGTSPGPGRWVGSFLPPQRVHLDRSGLRHGPGEHGSHPSTTSRRVPSRRAYQGRCPGRRAGVSVKGPAPAARAHADPPRSRGVRRRRSSTTAPTTTRPAAPRRRCPTSTTGWNRTRSPCTTYALSGRPRRFTTGTSIASPPGGPMTGCPSGSAGSGVVVIPAFRRGAPPRPGIRHGGPGCGRPSRGTGRQPRRGHGTPRPRERLRGSAPPAPRQGRG
ncbi:MAG: hypothetical protein QOC93_3017 [Actinomycetota bacterium]|jgi:hypothetical protein|nr:hypothetical protein [Actinomycetota bacterium]